jgi:hypothetical protein
VSTHVEVQNPTPTLLDDEEAVEQPERQGWHGEEVEGNDHLAVILEESQPAPARITAESHTSQVARHGSFGNLEAELSKLKIPAGRAEYWLTENVSSPFPAEPAREDYALWRAICLSSRFLNPHPFSRCPSPMLYQ